MQAILAALSARQQQTILIHGVTGSGKTEVYIQAIQEVVRFGRQAIVLVPEISLTPQTVERFRRRFGAVAVLHSHLSDAERHWHWQRIAEGEVSVVVGARSAIFAPTPQLGLIVLDEEHETSFKQESAPRYHARDVAIARAAAEEVPLVLGSATPSLESWHRAQTGEYTLVEMPRRVLGRPLPAVGTIDLRDQQCPAAGCRRGHQPAIARRHASPRWKEGGQVILLLNRRGFSTHIQCPACGHVVRCPALRHRLDAPSHAKRSPCATIATTRCRPRRPARPAISPGIRYSGLGTQRLEAEVRARFPGVDLPEHGHRRDAGPAAAMSGPCAEFRSGKVRILLGTQMIAKGLDFPNVTLVGVINADTALHLPDFRAAERTFHLVTQVAGRTGRGPKGGRVLVQTFSPDHPAIQAAVRHDFAAFAAGELPIRQMLRYPPFASMIRLVVRGPAEPVGGRFALHCRAAEGGIGSRRLTPGCSARPRALARLRGKYRFQIQVQGPDGQQLRAAVRQAAGRLEPPDGVQWIVDVDPLEML